MPSTTAGFRTMSRELASCRAFCKMQSGFRCLVSSWLPRASELDLNSLRAPQRVPHHPSLSLTLITRMEPGLNPSVFHLIASLHLSS